MKYFLKANKRKKFPIASRTALYNWRALSENAITSSYNISSTHVTYSHSTLKPIKLPLNFLLQAKFMRIIARVISFSNNSYDVSHIPFSYMNYRSIKKVVIFAMFFDRASNNCDRSRKLQMFVTEVGLGRSRNIFTLFGFVLMSRLLVIVQ